MHQESFLNSRLDLTGPQCSNSQLEPWNGLATLRDEHSLQAAVLMYSSELSSFTDILSLLTFIFIASYYAS